MQNDGIMSRLAVERNDETTRVRLTDGAETPKRP